MVTYISYFIVTFHFKTYVTKQLVQHCKDAATLQVGFMNHAIFFDILFFMFAINPDVSFSGPGRWAHQLVSGRPALSALLSEPGGLLVSSATVSHTGLRIPASVLSPALSATIAVLHSKSGFRIPAPTGSLSLNKSHPSAPTVGVAFAAVTTRWERAPFTVSPCFEPWPQAGVPRCAPSSSRTGGGGSSAWRRLSDASGEPSRDRWHSGMPSYLMSLRYWKWKTV